MANEGVCMALRLAWTRYLVHTKQFSSQNIVIREKLVNLAFGASGRQTAKQLAENISTKVQKACFLFTRQCNVIAGQRVWRAFQIASWYRQLYGETRLLQTLKANLLRHCKNRNLYMLLSAAGIFQWERDGVTDQELHRWFPLLQNERLLLVKSAVLGSGCGTGTSGRSIFCMPFQVFYILNTNDSWCNVH